MEPLTDQQLLQNFKQQKTSQESVLLLEAQRLVNLYRAIHCFPENFVQQYNKILLDASTEVKRMLSSVMGGAEVRSYADFLEHQLHHASVEEKTVGSEKMTGYLPQPQDDLKQSESPDSMMVSKSEWSELQKQYQDLKTQNQTLLQQLKERSKVGNNQNDTSAFPGSGSYSEVIEDS